MSFRDIKKYCEFCGKKLLLKSKRDIKRKRFCSRNCLGKYNALNGVTFQPPHKPKKQYFCLDCGRPKSRNTKNDLCQTCFNKKKIKNINFKCANCGKKLSWKLYAYKNSIYKCCDRKCSIEFKKKNGLSQRKVFICKNCGKRYTKYKSLIVSEKHFCSRSCSSYYYGIKNRTKLGFYIDGRTPFRKRLKRCAIYKKWRNTVYERDGYICKQCGESIKRLHAHHIIEFSDLITEFLKVYPDLNPEKDCDELIILAFDFKPFWNIKNGITLCTDCHMSEHGLLKGKGKQNAKRTRGRKQIRLRE